MMYSITHEPKGNKHNLNALLIISNKQVLITLSGQATAQTYAVHNIVA